MTLVEVTPIILAHWLVPVNAQERGKAVFMRCLITGGAGFLGSALANRLVSLGHQVRALDDLSAGDQTRLGSGVTFFRGDTRDIPKLWTLLRGLDCVYHLAARVSVPESILYPVEYNDVNVGGTVSLMSAVRDAQVKRVVLTSSGAAYGEQDEQPVSERLRLHPQTPYAVSKMAAEQYVLAIGALWGIETVILRVFNAYGPGQPLPPSHAPVIPRFLKQAVAGGSLVVHGDGTQSRDFVYIDDVVDALISSSDAQGVNRSIINVGSGTETSIDQLAQMAGEVTGKKIEVIHNSATAGGVSRLVADITLARETLGYSPKVSMMDGLHRVMRMDPRFGPDRQS